VEVWYSKSARQGGGNWFCYKAVGIVSAHYSKYREYSWITKIDYIDSVFASAFGHGWGVSEEGSE